MSPEDVCGTGREDAITFLDSSFIFKNSVEFGCNAVGHSGIVFGRSAANFKFSIMNTNSTEASWKGNSIASSIADRPLVDEELSSKRMTTMESRVVQ